MQQRWPNRLCGAWGLTRLSYRVLRRSPPPSAVYTQLLASGTLRTGERAVLNRSRADQHPVFNWDRRARPSRAALLGCSAAHPGAGRAAQRLPPMIEAERIVRHPTVRCEIHVGSEVPGTGRWFTMFPLLAGSYPYRYLYIRHPTTARAVSPYGQVC